MRPKKATLSVSNIRKLKAMKNSAGLSPEVVEVDGLIKVIADGFWANYYGPRGYSEINPRLERFAEARGCFWEWENPEAIVIYPA